MAPRRLPYWICIYSRQEGLVSAGELRSSAFSSSVPIILLMMQEDKALLRAWEWGAGVSAILCLPFELRELLAAVAAAAPATRSYAEDG